MILNLDEVCGTGLFETLPEYAKVFWLDFKDIWRFQLSLLLLFDPIGLIWNKQKEERRKKEAKQIETSRDIEICNRKFEEEEEEYGSFKDDDDFFFKKKK